LFRDVISGVFPIKANMALHVSDEWNLREKLPRRARSLMHDQWRPSQQAFPFAVEIR
jgi:hypothetical protein